MSRVPMRTAMALRRRPRRARWTPWTRTQLIVAAAVLIVVAITIARGIIVR